MDGFFIFGIFIVVFAVGLGIVAWLKHRQRSVWQALAQELGLTFVDGGWFDDPSIYGNHHGARINVETEVQGSGKNKNVFTVVTAPLSAATPTDLEVYQEGFFEKVGKTFGGQDIQVGDAELDDTFIIKGRDRSRIRELLTEPAVKARLLSSHNKYPTFRLDIGNVCLRVGGRTSNAAKLRGLITTVVAAANAIEEACSAKPSPTQRSPRQITAPLSEQIGDPLAEQSAGLSTVPFGRPAASSKPDDDQPAAPSTPTTEPETADVEDNDWW